MNEDKFKKIDDLNKVLKNINEVATATLSDLGNIDNITQELAQKKVDDICERLSAKINSQLIVKRADLINTLHEGYVASNEIVQLLEPLVNFNLNIDTVVEAVQKIIDIIAGPYKVAIEYMTQLAPKLIELTNNINDLASLKDQIPQPPNIPVVNFDKLQISMPPITLSEVITGNKTSGGTDGDDTTIV